MSDADVVYVVAIIGFIICIVKGSRKIIRLAYTDSKHKVFDFVRDMSGCVFTTVIETIKHPLGGDCGRVDNSYDSVHSAVQNEYMYGTDYATGAKIEQLERINSNFRDITGETVKVDSFTTNEKYYGCSSGEGKVIEELSKLSAYMDILNKK